jgi:hypothetical protein
VRWFHGNGRGGLVTPPSLQSLSADSNGPWQRRKRSRSSRTRGRSSSRGDGLGIVDRGAESESSTSSSTHPSLGRPYTPSLPDDSSEAEADADGDCLRKHSTNSHPSSKDVGSIHQLETLKSSVHRAPVTSLGWADSPMVDSMGNSIAKSDVGGDAVKYLPFDVVRLFYCLMGMIVFFGAD